MGAVFRRRGARLVIDIVESFPFELQVFGSSQPVLGWGLVVNRVVFEALFQVASTLVDFECTVFL